MPAAYGKNPRHTHPAQDWTGQPADDGYILSDKFPEVGCRIPSIRRIHPPHPCSEKDYRYKPITQLNFRASTGPRFNGHSRHDLIIQSALPAEQIGTFFQS